MGSISSVEMENPDDDQEKEQTEEKVSLTPKNPEDNDTLPGRVYMTKRSIKIASTLIHHWTLVVHFPTINSWVTLGAKDSNGQLKPEYTETRREPEGELVDVCPDQIELEGKNGFTRFLNKLSNAFYRAKQLKPIKHILISKDRLQNFVKVSCERKSKCTISIKTCESWTQDGIAELGKYEIKEVDFTNQVPNEKAINSFEEITLS